MPMDATRGGPEGEGLAESFQKALKKVRKIEKEAEEELKKAQKSK